MKIQDMVLYNSQSIWTQYIRGIDQGTDYCKSVRFQTILDVLDKRDCMGSGDGKESLGQLSEKLLYITFLYILKTLKQNQLF